MTSVLVIGPTKFAERPQPEVPSWVPTHLEESKTGEDPSSPGPLQMTQLNIWITEFHVGDGVPPLC